MTSRIFVFTVLMVVLIAFASAFPANDELGSGSTSSSNSKSSLYDDIFNIPISVLHAVRRLLTNNRGSAGVDDVGVSADASAGTKNF